MAVITLVQTDTAGSCAMDNYCEGAATECNATFMKIAQSGGTAGSTELSCSMPTVSTRILNGFDCPIDAGASWNGGTWQIPLNFSSGNMNITLEEIHICRVNSSCVNQETIGSSTGIGYNTFDGLNTFNVTGSAQTPDSGDRVIILCLTTNADSMMAQSVGITPSETINTPFDDGVTATGVGWYQSQGGWW